MTEPSNHSVVTDVAQLVRADNPNMMTLDGTNTWILRGAGSETSVVVDPGPLDEEHLATVLGVAGDVDLVLYTHHHFDHTECIDRFAELTGAPARALGEEFCRDADPLTDGELINAAGLALEIAAVPGHTTDSIAILVTDDGSLLTGDTVLGRGTTVVAHPDGQLGAYLSSLQRLHVLCGEQGITTVWPGHGPVIEDALGALDHYLAHRQQRLDQVRTALRDLHAIAREGGSFPHETLPRAIVEIVYADVDPVLWGAAELSVRAQLAYLTSTSR
jgi:glyoxylase-like metal-dependent hydrolase (beta-lactamase superfamily II)